MTLGIVIDIRALAMLNIAVQLVLLAFVFGAVYLARRGRVVRHCAIQRGTLLVQIIAILGFMLPMLLGFAQSATSLPLFYPELLIHHSFGLILVGMWVYINLDVSRRIKQLIKRKTAMRFAFGVWVVTIVLGLHIYYTLYLA